MIAETFVAHEYGKACDNGHVKQIMFHDGGHIVSTKCSMIVEKFVSKQPDHNGRIGFLITSDEEGPAKLGTIKVRLHGIDAPESRQNCKDAKNKAYACGRKSTAFLKSLVKNKEVKCEGKDKDR